jgi:hypothetical protein
LHCWTVDPRNAALKNSDVHNIASWHVHRVIPRDFPPSGPAAADLAVTAHPAE